MSNAKRVMWIFDIHGPERDERALRTAVKAHQVFNPHITIIGGDVMDNRAFSAHPVQKRGQNTDAGLANEFRWANGLLDTVQRQTIENTIFLAGNHEAWIERFCAQLPADLAASLGGLLSPQAALSAGRKNFKWIDYKIFEGTRQNEYELPHGVVTVHGMSTARAAATAHLEKYKHCKSVVFGHTHRAQTERIGLPNGRTVEAINPGCLCRLRPTYTDGPTSWVHGYLVGYFGRKSYTLYPCKIERGYSVLPSGKEISG